MSVSKTLTIEQAEAHARIAIKQGNMVAALELYTAILQHQSDHQLAKEWVDKLQADRMVVASAQIDPSPDVLKQLSDMFYADEKAEVELHCRKLLQDYPRSITVLNILGVVLQQLNKPVEAVEIFDQLILVKPDLAEAYSNRGNALNNLGRNEEAVESYKKAIELSPDYVDAHFNLGNILLELGKSGEALSCYDRVLELKETHLDARLNKGVVLGEMGELEMAEQEIERVIYVNDGNAMAYYSLGGVLVKQQKLEKAIDAYSHAFSLKPEWAEAYHYCALLYQRLGKLDQAIICFQKSIDTGDLISSPQLLELLNYYPDGLANKGLYSRAQQAMQNISKKCAGGNDITSECIKSIFIQGVSIVSEYKPYMFSKGSQLFRGVLGGLKCDRDKKIFDTFNVIPRECFNCYKVTIKPRNVVELFKLHFLFDRESLTFNNGRKTMVETRPNVKGFYKGFIYCTGLDEGRDVLDKVKVLMDEHIAKNIPIELKRGCTEYYENYPQYADVQEQGEPLMKYDETWAVYEDDMDEQISKVVNNKIEGYERHHPGLSLFDIVVMRYWLSYAATVGDDSYLKVTDGVEMPTVDDLKRKKFSL
jgi:tetratricopeptide (TPR) repeat protein